MEGARESEAINGDDHSTSSAVDDGGMDGGRTTVKLHRRHETLHGVLRGLISTILFPDHDTAAASAPLLSRVKISVSEHGPRLREASRSTGRDVLLWTRQGSPLRAVLVISVGMITLLTLTGLSLFMLFFLAATVNAIIISLIMSLAAAGGFLAIFFTCVTAIYIWALSVAAFVIFATTVSAIIGTFIVAGWIGFFCIVWLVTKKSLGLAKHSLSVTGSALSAYSSARHARHHHEREKVVAY